MDILVLNLVSGSPATIIRSLNCMSNRSRYEAPIVPDVDVLRESAVEAFPVAIVGFAVAFSVAKVYSVKHDYTIDGNQVSYHTGSHHHHHHHHRNKEVELLLLLFNILH